MPVDPYTWQLNDFVTASRLDNDLYAINALAYNPNGTRFHARKPLYKAMQAATGLSVNAGAYRGLFQSAGANVLVDNSAYFGVQMDPDYAGIVQDGVSFSNGNPNLPQGGSGNLVGGGGGWYLVSAFAPLGGHDPNSPYRANITNSTNGFPSGGPNLLSCPQACAGNANHDVTPWVCDLIYFDGGSYMPVAFNGAASAANLATTIDGSGETSRFHAMWASVLPQYGFQVPGGPAPIQSWTGANSDIGSAQLNSAIRNTLRVFNMPPALRVNAGNSGGNIPSGLGTNTTINLSSVQLDSYGGWNGSNTYTVPFDGIYLCYGAVSLQAAGSAMPARCGIKVNSTNKQGPVHQMAAGNNNNVATVKLLDLQAGDTVQLIASQASGSTVSCAGNIPPVLLLLWMGARSGFPASLPSVPDLSYRYTAGLGAAGTTQTAFNTGLGNDLTFLYYRPFLLSKQGTAQAISQGTNTVVTMDTVGGIIHSGTGDPYSGWDAVNTRYVAPRPGWYLATFEVFFGTPSLTVTPSTIAQFRISTSAGVSNYDQYGHQNVPPSQSGGGASAMGYYYLRAGDWIEPVVQTQDTASGSFSTVTSPNSHFECIWVSE